MALTGCFHFPDNSPIVIGGIAPLGGYAVLYGEWGVRTANLRLKQINDAGGINGRELQIVWENGKCSKEDAARAAKDLIDDYSVKVILGGACSDETLGAAPITGIHRVVLLSPTSTAPQITEAGEFVFRIAPANAFSGKLLADYVVKNGMKKVGIIQETTEFTRTLSIQFADNFNGEIFRREESDPDAMIQLMEEKVDILFLNVNSFRSLNKVLDMMNDLDFDIPIMVNELGLGGLEIMATYREVPIESEIVGVTFDIDLTNSRLVDFQQLYQEEYGQATNYWRFATMAIDALDVIAEVLRNVEDVRDSEEIRDTLQAVQHPGISGPIHFDRNGDIIGEQILLRFDGKKFIPFAE